MLTKPTWKIFFVDIKKSEHNREVSNNINNIEENVWNKKQQQHFYFVDGHFKGKLSIQTWLSFIAAISC